MKCLLQIVHESSAYRPKADKPPRSSRFSLKNFFILVKKNYDDTNLRHMKKYFAGKLKKTKNGTQNLRAKVIVRVQNLAKRMDLGHTKGEKKK